MLWAKSLPVPIGRTAKAIPSKSIPDLRDSSITHSTVPSPPQITMYTVFLANICY